MIAVESPARLITPRATYIHIPFCAHKCGYCDFASVAGMDELADRYLSALEMEMERGEAPHEVDNIFIGGGTPTRLNPRQLERLLDMTRRWYPLSAGGEWTVEANPGTLDRDKVDVLADGGVERVSLGAQSFRPETLTVLERNHGPEEVARALEMVRQRFRRWSIDLIFGVPGSTLDDWKRDLEIGLAFGPDHLSCYGLVYEKGTALWKSWNAGRVTALDEETERAMYEHTIDRLERAELAMYEISNFARAGHESRHNLVYWANEPYFGVGLGAARFVGGVRASNTRDLLSYIRRMEGGGDPTGPSECLEPEAHARETAVLMLRRTKVGLEREDFERRTGFSLDALAGAAIAKHRRGGLIDDDGRRIRFTHAGLFLADSVLCDLL